MTLREAAQQALENICAAMLCEFNSMSSRSEMVRLMRDAVDSLRAALAKPQRRYSCPICAGAMIDDADERDLDEMLVVRHLSPRKDYESLRSCVDRIIDWEVAINLDPAVSSAARGLVESGRAAQFDPAQQSAGSPQTADKPVAWLAQGPEFRQLAFSVSYVPGCHFTPLYARPPRGCSGCGAGVHDTADSMTALYCVKCGERANAREWQGLTDAEISDIVRSAVRGTLLNRDGGTSLRIARAIEQALKEKNT